MSISSPSCVTAVQPIYIYIYMCVCVCVCAYLCIINNSRYACPSCHYNRWNTTFRIIWAKCGQTCSYWRISHFESATDDRCTTWLINGLELGWVGLEWSGSVRWIRWDWVIYCVTHILIVLSSKHSQDHAQRPKMWVQDQDQLMSQLSQKDSTWLKCNSALLDHSIRSLSLAQDSMN